MIIAKNKNKNKEFSFDMCFCVFVKKLRSCVCVKWKEENTKDGVCMFYFFF